MKPREKRSDGVRADLARKLEIDGQQWSWQASETHVVIRHPDKKTTTRVPHSDVSGRDRCWELIRDWNDCGCRIGPGQVTEYIRKSGLK